MIVEPGSEILLKTLQLCCLLIIGIVFVNCSKKMKRVACSKKMKADQPPEWKPKNQKNGKSTKLRRDKKKKGKSDEKNIDEENDGKINLNIKEPEARPDEFDDDEENPLAKIPTKSQDPKVKKKDAGSVTRNKSKLGSGGTPSTSKTTSTASPSPGCSPTHLKELEAPLWAINEKQIGSSCYVRLD